MHTLQMLSILIGKKKPWRFRTGSGHDKLYDDDHANNQIFGKNKRSKTDCL